MKSQFNVQFLSSFALWFDNKVADAGQGYVNRGSQFYLQNELSRTGYIYAAPYKQMVYDSCVSGATIISGVYTTSGQFLTRNSGININFQEGRIFTPYKWGPTLSGNFAQKEYNLYISTEEDAEFFLEQLYNVNSDLTYSPTGTPFLKFAAPCVILTNSANYNKPFAFGGQDESKKTIRAFIISNNNWNQEAITSLLVDSARSYFPLVSYEDVPINIYGDLKTGYYSYCDLKSRYGCKDVYIENVYSLKLNEKTNKNKTFTIALLEIDCSTIRYPRAQT